VISFCATEDEAAFTELARNIAEDRVRPLARECENNGEVDKKLIEQLQDLGFLSLELPEDWGGLSLPLITQVQVLQALSYGDLGTMQGLPGAGDTASFIRLTPDYSFIQSYKEELKNKKAGAFIDMNDDLGDNLTLLPNDDGYILQGESKPVRLAAFADYVFVGGEDARGKHVVLLLNNPNDWKVENGDYRLGLLASGLGRFLFDAVQISKRNILAEGEDAKNLLRQARTRIYILEAAKEVGLMEAALDYATAYTAERKAFGQEIAKFQGVSFRIAKMAVETKAARNLIWEAAINADNQHTAAQGLALRALFRAHRSVRYVTDSAVQLLGGHGFVQEFPVEKWMRDAQTQVVLYGREKDLLVQRGKQIVAEAKEAAVL
jgi:hypothetical protein